MECLQIVDCVLRPGTVCSEGSCTCPTSGESFCSTVESPYDPRPPRCTNLAASTSDCGTCGNACFGACKDGACVDAWKVDPDLVNTKGGAIAIGHPLGASGGRIVGTLAARLAETGDRWGVAAICIGVGQGLAVGVEA